MRSPIAPRWRVFRREEMRMGFCATWRALSFGPRGPIGSLPHHHRMYLNPWSAVTFFEVTGESSLYKNFRRAFQVVETPVLIQRNRGDFRLSPIKVHLAKSLRPSRWPSQADCGFGNAAECGNLARPQDQQWRTTAFKSRTDRQPGHPNPTKRRFLYRSLLWRNLPASAGCSSMPSPGVEIDNSVTF